MQFKKYLFFFVSLGVLVLGVAVVSAVTTINSNVSTGDITVTGAAGITGAVTAGTLAVGTGGTVVTKMICTATTTDWAAFSVSSHCQWGTTTMTGLTASADGGWGVFVSPVATTSGISTVGIGISVMAYPTSTNVVEIKVCDSSSTDATNLPAQRYEICAISH
ncbi:MAG: hypothetical protein NTV62_02955 [Candidatus Gribaldobacteria bacterium]|nr:hypothetical protein [Candidatus Gribaldobacteria bacterium]